MLSQDTRNTTYLDYKAFSFEQNQNYARVPVQAQRIKF